MFFWTFYSSKNSEKSRILVAKQLTVAIDFHNMKKNTMEVNGYLQIFGYQHSFKYLQRNMFNIRRKLIQVWNKCRVSKLWHLVVSYSFNLNSFNHN